MNIINQRVLKLKEEHPNIDKGENSFLRKREMLKNTKYLTEASL